MASVQCAGGVVRRIAKLAPEVVAITHSYGCGQLGEDLAQTTRTLEGFASHPNVAGVLLVSLGCETLDTLRMTERLVEAGTNAVFVSIQEAGGTAAAAARGVALVADLLADAARAERVRIPVSELVLGLECGGSDSWSGVTANPALGKASDAIVGAGGTVILSETPEFIGAEHLLSARASPAVASQIDRAVAAWEDRARAMGVDLRGAQPTPGNIAGGLTTIEEKSLGAITKGGSSLVRELVGYACRPSERGLILMDTAGNDAESVTGMVAGGAQIVAFTTGRGSPIGCPIAPVIKIASHTELASRMVDDMDIDAGVVVSTGMPMETVGEEITGEILAVAAGKETASERWGSGEFAIGFVGTRF
jgi:altronate dehydratase large subunit